MSSADVAGAQAGGSDGIRGAFAAEAARLAEVMLALPEADFARPTGCAPWTVAELLAHVRTATGRLLDMLARPAPDRAEVDAAGYYGPSKFAAATDAARITGARREAATVPSGHALAEDFDRVWLAVRAAVVGQRGDRVVVTRHGDPMALDEFLRTRVVELGVHGLDLAAALDRAPWLTPAAAAVIERLLLGDAAAADAAPAGPARVDVAAPYADLGWDRLTFIAKATGRSPIDPGERAAVDRLGLRWLSFG
ncbi:maleylpyruvate isomerase N-terminal domain-containing protein [Plantactinospora siamensis]|uniref:Maleylpyruvate isomerase N-terminal domain-containing protein n=1 Tax=Plantactinospora siamensis TaxID=555372 RepID=A0ABV6NVZ7_9ACTN